MRLSLLRKIVLICSSLAVAAAAARAATGDALRAFLASVPATDESVTKSAVSYFDLAVAASITGKRGLDGLTPMVARVDIPHFGEMLASAAAWKEKAGFALEEVDAFASGGTPPDMLHFIRLTPAVRLETLTAAWAARGFRETQSGDVPLWGRGEPRTLDLSKIDPEDPFGGNLGRSSFLLPDLPWIAESFGPDPLVKVKRAKVDGALAARPDISALLAVIDAENGQLLQALLLPNPAASIAKEGDQIAFSAFLLADIEAGARAATLILLPLRECGAARAVRTFIESGWAAQPAAVSAYKPVWTLRQGSICVLIGRIAVPGAAAARDFGNTSYRLLVNALMRRELTAFVLSPDR